MAPCTFRFRNQPCPRPETDVFTGNQVAAINSWQATHTVNWARTGTPVCRPDYAYALAAIAPAQPWRRSVALNPANAVWVGTVAEFPTVDVRAFTQPDCNRLLDDAIAQAVYQLAAAGQAIPTPGGP